MVVDAAPVTWSGLPGGTCEGHRGKGTAGEIQKAVCEDGDSSAGRVASRVPEPRVRDPLPSIWMLPAAKGMVVLGAIVRWTLGDTSKPFSIRRGTEAPAFFQVPEVVPDCGLGMAPDPIPTAL